MELLHSIGERLKEVREAMGKSQSDFAAIAAAAGAPGTTRQSQAKYEKGLQAPSAPYLAALAANGIDVTYVLTGKKARATPVVKAAAVGVGAQRRLRDLAPDGVMHEDPPESPAAQEPRAADYSSSAPRDDEQQLITDLRRCSPSDRAVLRHLAARLAVLRR